MRATAGPSANSTTTTIEISTATIEVLIQQLEAAYLAIVDACDEMYPPDFEATGKPVSDVLRRLRELAA